VREDYLAGMSAPEACRRHGVGLSALRDRAGREGWRRIDQPWRPPNALDPWDEGLALEDRTGGDLDKIEMRELSFVAHRRMMRAALRGDAAEALRWRRVRLAMDLEEEEVQRFVCREDYLLDQRAEPAAPAAPAPALALAPSAAAAVSDRSDRSDHSDRSDDSDPVFRPKPTAGARP
jgi:hypothetical protein